MPRLKLKQFKHRFANSLVITLGAGKFLKWTAVGQVTDKLPEELAYKLAGQYTKELQLITDDAELLEEEETTKKAVGKSPSNKSASAPKSK